MLHQWRYEHHSSGWLGWVLGLPSPHCCLTQSRWHQYPSGLCYLHINHPLDKYSHTDTCWCNSHSNNMPFLSPDRSACQVYTSDQHYILLLSSSSKECRFFHIEDYNVPQPSLLDYLSAFWPHNCKGRTHSFRKEERLPERETILDPWCHLIFSAKSSSDIRPGSLPSVCLFLVTCNQCRVEVCRPVPLPIQSNKIAET